MKHINERAHITRPTKTSKKLLADDRLLKSLNLEEAQSNMRVYYEEKGNFFVPQGKFYIYFFDSHEAAMQLGKEIDFLFFPIRHRFDWNAAPITDIWKKSRAGKGTEHILGIVEGQVYSEEKIFLIQMMSVRPSAKKNHINTFMVQLAERFQKEDFPEFRFGFEDPTDDGLEFIKKYDPTKWVYWTFRNRPKKWDPTVFTNSVSLKESLLTFSNFKA